MRLARLWFLGALLAIAMGCVTVSGGEPDRRMRTYVLEPPPARATAPHVGLGVLLVSPPDARPGYDTPDIVYTRQASQISRYAYAEWAESPARMLEPLLIERLETSGFYNAVVDITGGVVADIRLDTEIVSLRQEFSGSGGSEVRVAVRAQLVDLRTRSVVATRFFEVLRPTATDDAYGGVIAINSALAELLDEVSSFCARAADARATAERE